MFDLGPRLGDHPHDTLRHALALHPEGMAVEFGVYRGATLRLIAAQMPAVGFDSFEGLPEDWRPGFSAGRFATKIPEVDGAELVIGRFEDTLPGWVPPMPLGLLHIDCDLYSSTATVLAHLEPHLRPGVLIAFDEWHGYPGAEAHEHRAWAEYVERTGAMFDVLGHGPEQWLIRLR